MFLGCLFAASALFYLIILLALVLIFIPKRYLTGLYALLIMIITFMILNLDIFLNYFFSLVFEAGRQATYFQIFLNTVQTLNLASNEMVDASSQSSGILKFYFDYGYLGLAAYVFFVGMILRFLTQNGNIFVILAFLSAVLFSLRSGELFPPILLFITSLTLTKLELFDIEFNKSKAQS